MYTVDNGHSSRVVMLVNSWLHCWVAVLRSKVLPLAQCGSLESEGRIVLVPRPWFKMTWSRRQFESWGYYLSCRRTSACEEGLGVWKGEAPAEASSSSPDHVSKLTDLSPTAWPVRHLTMVQYDEVRPEQHSCHFVVRR
ncbi:hypothetical protein TNCV_532951 [Trichonephila clavipes]|nr:hypothetical protein TNCV_532951 [Trichonephila clavipes]